MTELQTMHDDWQPEPTLVEFLTHMHELHPTFAVELFVRGDEAVRRRVLTDDGALRRSALEDGSVYHSPTVFQLKAMLYHTGILTERGASHTASSRPRTWGASRATLRTTGHRTVRV